MNVWRKQTVRWTLDGKRVKAGTEGAERCVTLSKRFYGTLRDANGKSGHIPLTSDKATSVTLLYRLQNEADQRKAKGILHAYETERPVAELLAEYVTHLQAKGNCKAYVTGATSRIRKLLTTTKAKTLADLDGKRIMQTLATWRKRGRSVATSNDYLIAVKAFSRWAWQERKQADDPLAGLRRMNTETDRRRVRRALTATELERLTKATKESPRTFRGDDWRMTPTDRVTLYLTAAYTGLRASELASLTKASFDLEAGTFFVDAKATKNRKAVTLPLHPSLAKRLRTWFATLDRNALWPGSWAKFKKAGRILQRDLKRAGIAYVDDAGRYADFHALRHTFITSLARAGVHPSKAKELARHSTITLTLDVYSHVSTDELREALNALPSIGTGRE